MKEATRFASAYAAVSVEKLGAATLPELFEVEQRLLTEILTSA